MNQFSGLPPIPIEAWNAAAQWVADFTYTRDAQRFVIEMALAVRHALSHYEFRYSITPNPNTMIKITSDRVQVIRGIDGEATTIWEREAKSPNFEL